MGPRGLLGPTGLLWGPRLGALASQACQGSKRSDVEALSRGVARPG